MDNPITTQIYQMLDALAEHGVELTPAVILSEPAAVRLFDEANGYLTDVPLVMLTTDEKIKQVHGGTCYGVKIFVGPT